MRFPLRSPVEEDRGLAAMVGVEVERLLAGRNTMPHLGAEGNPLVTLVTLFL